MPEPLRDADPRQLGAFRLQARLGSGPDGVVYLGTGSRGESAEIAMLSAGAASDAVARDRFRAAVDSGTGLDDPPRVLAANLSSPAGSWAAVPRETGSPGAGVLLAAAGAGGAVAQRGPGYLPYWGRGGAPASARWSWRAAGPAPAGGQAVERANPAMVLGALAVLLLFAALLVLLFLWMSSTARQAQAGPEPGSGPAAEQPSPPPSSSPSPSSSGEPSEGEGDDGEGEPSPVPSVSLEGEELPEGGQGDPTGLL